MKKVFYHFTQKQFRPTNTLYSLVVFVFLAGCSLDKDAMQGTWVATDFFENGQTIAIPSEQVSLVFNADDYKFTGTNKYQEAGTYRCSMHYLFLEDTTTLESKEKMLKVLYLSNDEMKIRMEKEGKEQVLFFKKQ